MKTSTRALLAPIAVWSALSVMPFTVVGCGGGGGGGGNKTPSSVTDLNVSPAATGRAQMTITWPVKTGRLIPDASSSIRAEVLRSGSVVASQLVPRPPAGQTTSTVTFDTLPIDTLTVRATAYPSADGTGVAQASGQGNVTTNPTAPATFSVTMASTIDHVGITPAAPLPTLALGQTVQLTATAYDASGAVVLVAPAKLQWSATGTSPASGTPVANVDATGLVTGTSPGTASVMIKDSESGKSASTSVPVSILAFVTGHIAYQVQFPVDPLIPPASRSADQINAYLMEADIVNGQITVRTLVPADDPNIYSTLNASFSPVDGRWLVFCGITEATPGVRDPQQRDKYDIYLLDTKTVGARPKNLTGGLFPNDRCQDPHFSSNGQQVVFQTNNNSGAVQVHVLDINFAAGTATEPTPARPLPKGVDPVLLSDGSIVYIDVTNPLRFLPMRWNPSTGVSTALALPSDFTSSYYVNPWGANRLVYTVNHGKNVVGGSTVGTPDYLAAIDLTTNTPTLFGSITNGGSANGGNNSDPCLVDDKTILFSRTTSAGYRLFIVQPGVDRVEAVLVPGIADKNDILGVSFSAN